MAKELLPYPRDQEEKQEFIDRFTTSRKLITNYSDLSSFKKKKMAESAWAEGKERSQVSIKNSEGEWLLFN